MIDARIDKATKATLLERLVQRLSQDLVDLERRQRDIQTGATHEESRSEHAKDTRATEQSYLARGLADRVGDLQRTLEAVRALELRDFAADAPIAVGALVSVSTAPTSEDRTTVSGPDGEAALWFVVPGAGGLEIDVGGSRVHTVTPVSPMGRALLGLCEGDEGSVRRPRGDRVFEVLAVR